MSLAKRMLEVDRSIWQIGDRHRQNPWVGHTVRTRWKRPWGKKPSGYEVVGTLQATFCKGRALIGLVETDTGKVVSCPWSRNWLEWEHRDLTVEEKAFATYLVGGFHVMSTDPLLDLLSGLFTEPSKGR